MTEWQTIETAPKNGDRILVCGSEGDMQVLAWEFYYPEGAARQGCEQLGWVIYAGQMGVDFGENELTHWMPLPQRPESQP